MSNLPQDTAVPLPDLGFGASFDNLHQSFTKRMTIKSPASTFATANHSPYNEALLTPQLTSNSLDDPPFKAHESDKTSLSMKRRRSGQHYRRRLNRAYFSSGDIDENATLEHVSHNRTGFSSRSKSAPILAHTYNTMGKARDTDNMKQAQLLDLGPTTGEVNFALRRNSLPHHTRRWTMPTKAAPTRVLTGTSSSAVRTLATRSEQAQDEQQAQGRGPSVDSGSVETPAMIILQEVTEQRSRNPSLRSEGYISFPTPDFGRSRMSFLASVFGNTWQKDNSAVIHTTVESVSVTSRKVATPSSSSRASIDRGSVNPSHSTTVAPVCTEVLVDPIFESEASGPQVPYGTRRCSTKYVSGVTTYEIIWDENISTSGSVSNTTSSRNSRRMTAKGGQTFQGSLDRRHSVAMDKLETQLFKAVQQSRKASLASRQAASDTALPSVRRNSQQNLSQNMMNFKFSSHSEQSASKDLSRSRGSTTSKHGTISVGGFEVQLTTLDDYDTPTAQVDFFPPLSPTRTAMESSTNPLLVNPWRTSWKIGSEASIPMSQRVEKAAGSHSAVTHQEVDYGTMPSEQRRGSMIGRTTGMRKKSVQKRRRRGKRSLGASRPKQMRDDELMPLLS